MTRVKAAIGRIRHQALVTAAAAVTLYALIFSDGKNSGYLGVI